MAKTIVGLFNSMEQAENVKQALISEDFPASHITVVANNTGHSEETTTEHTGGKVSHFFSNLFGGDDEAHEYYANGVNSGGALLAATVDDEDAAEVAAMLKQHGAKDIDGNKSAADAGTPVYGGSGSDVVREGTTIPVIEENLVVGKRDVDRGGVRVYSHVVETPVATDVTLHDEFINVERRFVDRPATAADFAAGAGKTIELNATGEEAVVGKTARVVEEVVVGKEGSQHTQTISDSVRKTEVNVEEVDAVATTGTTASKTSY